MIIEHDGRKRTEINAVFAFLWFEAYLLMYIQL